MHAIKVNDVCKKFKIFYDKGKSFKEKLLFKNRSRYEDRWVLSGISFTVEKGETLGLIGQNGCGKSTMLKLLTKIMYPDKGNIQIDGRVSSLIELGAGFHPDMSGRENIYTNASIFGLSKKEIDKRLHDIIDFSELGEFIDNPVRTYSSGMYMRLAFSVAINVDADILLIDEILAVGDANFQAKCFDKLRDLKHAGLTIVIVTHDLSTVEKFCTNAIWINNGKIASSGKSAQVIDDYLRFMNDKRYDSLVASAESADQTPESASLAGEPAAAAENGGEVIAEAMAPTGGSDTDSESSKNAVRTEQGELTEETAGSEEPLIDYNANRFGLKHIEIVKAEFIGDKGSPVTVLRAERSVTLEITYKLNNPLEGYNFGFSFHTLDGMLITGTNTQLDRLDIPEVKQHGKIKLIFDSVGLISGKYILSVAVVDQNGTPMDFHRNYCYFDVVSSDRGVGLVSIKHRWEIG